MFLSYKGIWSADKDIRSIYALYSTGLGVGYRLTHFLDIRAEAKVHRLIARRANALRGIVLEPSVRYWHYVASSLPDGRVNFMTDAGDVRTHTPYNFGLFANVSVGYTFGVRTR